MANLIETVDLQRAIRAAAYKKAAQLYGGKNLKRGWAAAPTTNQIRGIFRIGYSRLQHAHPRTKWMLFKYKPAWITKLDYYAARGGKPVILCIATNDGLAAAARNLGDLLNRRHYYFVPFGQDDPVKKPTSLVANFSRVPETVAAALRGTQLQPILLKA